MVYNKGLPYKAVCFFALPDLLGSAISTDKTFSDSSSSTCHALKNFRVIFFLFYYYDNYETQELTKVFTCSVQINAALIAPFT